MLFVFAVTIYFLAFLAILIAPKNRNSFYGWTAVVSAGASFLSIVYVGFTHALPEEAVFYAVSLYGITANFGTVADTLSLTGMALVSAISFFVFLYAHDYMREDVSQKRFFAEMCLFAGAMTGILVSPSLIQMFVFWELVGLASFLLIGFWYEKPEVAKAAQKVFTLIMFGDVLLLAGIILFGSEAGSWNFSAIASLEAVSPVLALGLLLILGGAFVKSAQVPFSFWLPWAMEGPTPVSALLHSATMVKAGAFLAFRILPLMLLAGFGPFISAVALFTIIIAGVSALAERDIKRILAYSTVSQLGFIFLAIGLGEPGAGLFHLTSDAFYKALLFLAAGVVIHLGENRDIFLLKSFGLKKNAVVISLAAVGVLGISGFPVFGGFFSKDAILEAARHHSLLIYFSALLGALLTNLYISRWFFSILKAGKTGISQDDGAHRSIFGLKTKIAMSALAAAVVSFGFIGMRYFSSVFYNGEPGVNFEIIGTTFILLAAGFTFGYFAYYKESSLPAFFETVFFGIPHRICVRSFGFAAFSGGVALLGLRIGAVFAIIDGKLIDGALSGCVAIGKGIAGMTQKIDLAWIDRALNKTIFLAIGLANGCASFDRGRIDRMVQCIGELFHAVAERVRPFVNGLLSRYLITFAYGVIGLIVFLNFINF